MKNTVMLVASSGGHWTQLNRLLPAVKDCELFFVTTDKKYSSMVGKNRFFVVPDATRWSSKLKVVWLALIMLKIILWLRPHVIITTGAAPGFFALFWGKKLGVRTIWLDSIANVDELSMSGQRVKAYADLWLTQWEHLESPDGPRYVGAVL